MKKAQLMYQEHKYHHNSYKFISGSHVAVMVVHGSGCVVPTAQAPAVVVVQ